MPQPYSFPVRSTGLFGTGFLAPARSCAESSLKESNLEAYEQALAAALSPLFCGVAVCMTFRLFSMLFTSIDLLPFPATQAAP